MPITSIGSYLTTGSEFESHWEDVNADRTGGGGSELALPDGHALADFSADLAALAAAITNVEDLDNGVSLAISDRDNQRENLRDRLLEFRNHVTLKMKRTGYVRGLPRTPHASASQQKLLRALDDVSSLWTRINADTSIPNFTPPLLLRGAYSLAGFTADLQTLRDNYKAVVDAENDARIQRKNRDVLLDPLRDHMIDYRQSIEVEYGPGHPFTQSLPDVSVRPGSTPDAVTLSGAWDTGLLAAVFSWNESTEPALERYELRMSPGASYDSGDATVVEAPQPGETTAQTSAGLVNSGDVASFKLYVVLATGNEAGSNVVTITRP